MKINAKIDLIIDFFSTMKRQSSFIGCVLTTGSAQLSYI